MLRREGEGLRIVSGVAVAMVLAMVLLPLSRVLASSPDGGGSSVESPRLDDATSSGPPQSHPMNAPPIADAGPDHFVAANPSVSPDNNEEGAGGVGRHLRMRSNREGR